MEPPSHPPSSQPPSASPPPPRPAAPRVPPVAAPPASAAPAPSPPQSAPGSIPPPGPPPAPEAGPPPVELGRLWRELKLSGQILGISAVLLVLGVLMPWASVRFGIFGGSAAGINFGQGVFALLMGGGVLGVLIWKMRTRDLNMRRTQSFIILGLTALNFIIVISALVQIGGAYGVGLILSFLASIGLAVGCFFLAMDEKIIKL